MNPFRALIKRVKAHYAEAARALYRQDARADSVLEENERLRQRLEELHALTTIAALGRHDEYRSDS